MKEVKIQVENTIMSDLMGKNTVYNVELFESILNNK